MKRTLVIFPVLGVGHFVSMMELSKRILLQNSRLSITVLLMHSPIPMPAISSQIDVVKSCGLHIDFIQLPAIEVPNIQEVGVETFISVCIENYKPVVSNHLRSLSTSLDIVAFLTDLFCSSMVDVTAEFGVPTYVFFTSGAAFLSIMLHLPTLDSTIQSEFKDSEHHIEIPGMSPLPVGDIPSPMVSRKNNYKWFLYHSRRLREVKGILVNTFYDLERGTMEAMPQILGTQGLNPTVLNVGPILALDNKSPNHECLRWLAQQPDASVVYLCFGSLGAFSDEQVREIAHGLEVSGHRFLWSVRSKGGLSLMLSDANLDEILPEGFLDRTRDRGLVWPTWVPQIDILSHPAVGGFVSHCGWNSILESVWFGVPLITWPLGAEQRMNAFLLVNDMGLAVGLEREGEEDGGLVRAEEVERAVRSLMEGEEAGKRAREKMKAMKELARRAAEEGGSSCSNLVALVDEWAKSR